MAEGSVCGLLRSEMVTFLAIEVLRSVWGGAAGIFLGLPGFLSLAARLMLEGEAVRPACL